MKRDLGSIVLITFLIFLSNIVNADRNLPVPYIHQVGDTHEDFDGRWACGATSAVMITASHNRLTSHPIDCDYCIPSHSSEYGWYVSKEYTLYGYTFDKPHPTPTGTACGAYGYIHDYVENDPGYAIREHARGYFRRHGLFSKVIPNPTETDVKYELDKNHPVWASTNLWSSGHIVVIRGYTDDGDYIVNDPAPIHPDIKDKPSEQRENLWFSQKEYHCYNANREPMFYSWDEMEISSKWIVTADPISPGDRVKALFNSIYVREESSISANDKGFVNTGDTGTILDDSTYGCFHNADGYTWWKIQWDDGKEGWSACGDRGYGENWLEKIESLPLGDLAVYVKDQKGDVKSEVEVIRYDKDWNEIDSKKTDSSGRVSWEDITAGEYHLEAYNSTPVVDAGEFWGDLTVDVPAGGSVEKTIQRYMPYSYDVRVTDSEGNPLVDDKITRGQKVKIHIEVSNDSSETQKVKVQCQADQERDTSDADVEFTEISDYVDMPSCTCYTFTFEFTPASAGEYYVRPKQTITETIGDQPTDSWEWPSSSQFTVSNSTFYAVLDVPFVHQTYDTPDDFVGTWACAPTSAVMILAYYNRVLPNPINVSYPSSHDSDYGKYISQEYTYNGH